MTDIQGGDTTDRALPPYADRKTGAPVDPQRDTHVDGANVGGATGPVENDEQKATPKEDTPRGAVASPADEQPADEMPETDLDDDAVGPAHAPGTGRGENQVEGQH